MKGIVHQLPVILALVGAGAGVCGAMLLHQDPAERARVRLDHSLPFAFLGLVIGAAAGWLVALICTRWPRLATVAGVGAAGLLGVAFAAPLGWIAGDLTGLSLAREGMAAGAAAGAAFGLGIGLMQLRIDRRRPQIEDTWPDAEVADYQELPSRSASHEAPNPTLHPEPRRLSG